MSELPLRSYLDPRPAIDAHHAPYLDCVNIPLEEIQTRVHELPSRKRELLVVGEASLVASTIALLEGSRLCKPGPPPIACAEFEPGRLWEPNGFLAGAIEDIEVGRCVDLACGTGRDAVYLASKGWQVTGIDLLPDAISKAESLARASGLSELNPSFLNADVRFLADLKRPFDLVCCFFYFDATLASRAVSMLRPNGHFLMESFTDEHRRRFGRPGPGRATPSNLPDIVRQCGFRIVEFGSGWQNDMHTGRLHACL